MAGLFPAIALAEPADFAIPAESADRALLDFSKQAGAPVIFPFDELSRARSNAVNGRWEPAEALALLLRGTAFAGQQNRGGTFVITRAGAPTEPGPAAAGSNAGAGLVPTAAGTTRLAPFVVQGRAESGSDRTQASEVAIGNLDLERTADDPLPFTVFPRSQIAQSGTVNLDDFLRENVLESDAGTPPPSEAGGGASYLGGSTNMNLRGFGSDETLILVNGLPMPQMLSGGITNGSTTTSREADVNLIPLSLVERVEVLPVSAAALYSGNPVGGVINIVLRPIDDISELTLTYANGTRVDAPQSTGSLMHGQTLLNGRLGLRLNASFTKTVPPTEQELGYIRANLAAHPNLGDPAVYPPPLWRATPNISSVSGAPLFGPGTSPITSVAPGADGSGGLGAFAGRAGLPSLALFQAPGGDADSPDSLNYAYGRRQTNQTYFGSATYDLFPRVQIGFNAYLSRSQTNPGFDVFTSPANQLKLGAASPFNPFGQDVYVNVVETAPQLGEGYEEARTDLYSAVLALLARLPGDWRLTLDAQYAHTTTAYRGLAGVDTQRWQDLIDQGLYNPLRDTELYGPPPAFYTQALVYFGGPQRFVRLDDFQSIDATARLANEALPLPTGVGTVRTGIDYSIDDLADFDDRQTYGDGSPAGSSGLWLGRTLQQVSALAEGQAPLLAPAWRPPGLQNLAVDAAARYTVSDTTYGSNVAPTVGLKADFFGGFSVRASLANTNRFPTPAMSRFEPTGGGAAGATGAPTGQLIEDPLRGGESYYVSASDIPNTALRPEADITRSAGLIFARGQTHRFRVSVDYFDTRKSGELVYLDAQDVLDYANLLPGRVTREAPAPGDPYGIGLATNVLTGNLNLAWRHSQDWSTAVDYAWNACAGGTLQLYGRWVYFQRYDREIVPNAPVVDELNAPDTSGLDLLRNRINVGASWSNRRYGFGVDGQYFSRRILPELLWSDQGSHHIASFCPIGAYVKRDLTTLLPWKGRRFGLTAQLRIDNILSVALPQFPDNPSGTGVEPYGDWRGRVGSVSLTATY